MNSHTTTTTTNDNNTNHNNNHNNIDSTSKAELYAAPERTSHPEGHRPHDDTDSHTNN